MAGGGAAPPPKQDENLPHPVKDQLPNVSYCITSPPPWRQFLLTFFQTLITLSFHAYFIEYYYIVLPKTDFVLKSMSYTCDDCLCRKLRISGLISKYLLISLV